MRRGSPGYFSKPTRRGVRIVAYKCVCGFGTNIYRVLVEHQQRCLQARLERAERQEGAQK